MNPSTADMRAHTNTHTQRESAMLWFTQLSLLNQVCFNTSSDEGLSLGSYLSTYCKRSNTETLLLCNLVRPVLLWIDSPQAQKDFIPGDRLIMAWLIIEMSEVWATDPKNLVVCSQWPSSQLSMSLSPQILATEEERRSGGKFVYKAAEVPISILWSKGALRINSGSFDTMLDLQVKLLS